MLFFQDKEVIHVLHIPYLLAILQYIATLRRSFLTAMWSVLEYIKSTCSFQLS